MRKLIPSLITAAAIACLAATPAYAATTVSVEDNSFQPKSVTVSVGDTVTWTHNGAAPHDVKADDGSFASPAMAAGDDYSHRFNSAGTFGYFCSFHGSAGGSGMSGTVVVRATVSATGGGAEETDGLATTSHPLRRMGAIGLAFIAFGAVIRGSGRSVGLRA